MIKPPQRSLAALFSLAVLSWCVGCTPDESPFRQENESLRKQLAKQESVMNSLQDGNKVMQQQIDLLNQELRDAKKQAEHAQAEAKALQAEAKALGTKLDSQLAESKKLSGEIQRTAAKAAPDGGLRLDVFIEQIEGRMARAISQGTGISPTLERRYGLNPAMGAVR